MKARRQPPRVEHQRKKAYRAGDTERKGTEGRRCKADQEGEEKAERKGHVAKEETEDANEGPSCGVPQRLDAALKEL